MTDQLQTNLAYLRAVSFHEGFALKRKCSS